MKIKLTKDIKEANCITHNGKFHCDEVFSTVILSKLLPEIILCRTNNVENVTEKQYVYDIGGGELDHHQFGENGERENGVKYSSCGLVWKKFGKEIIKKYKISEIEYAYEKIDKELLEGIDAIDNGQYPETNANYKLNSLSDIISDFNPTWDDVKNEEEQFLKALNFAEIIFDNFFKNIISKLNAKEKVELAIENSNEKIMILEQFLPWREFLLESENYKAKEINFVIFPSNRGGYNIYAVPEKLNSINNKKDFPKEWAGLRDEELQKISGIKTAKFCHNGRFICVTETKEDAIMMAKIANKM